jgi:hypothetical protein
MQDLPPMINPASLPRQAMCSGLSRLRTCFKSLALILSDRKPEVPLRAKRFAKRTRWKRATGESPRSGRLEGCAARLLRRPRPSRRPCRPPQDEGLGSVYASKQDLSALRPPQTFGEPRLLQWGQVEEDGNGMPSLARFQSSQPARRLGVVQFEALPMMRSRHALPVDSAAHVPHKRHYGMRYAA